MPDTKFSALPAATTVMNADEIPIVQGGVDKKCTKAQLLTGGVAENLLIQSSAGQTLQLASAGGISQILMPGSGDITLNAFNQLILSLAGPDVNAQILSAGGGIWVPPLPVDMATAIRRLAVQVSLLLGGPIP